MSSTGPVLYLIDGHAQIFRAYHAIRTSMNSPVTSEPTQAVFGFARMLLKLFLQFSPDYVAVAIDLPGPTFRDEIYAEYKANRPPAPEDLPKQAERIFELCGLFGIPLISHEGAEADDCIATICRRLTGGAGDGAVAAGAADSEPVAKGLGGASADLKIRVVSRDKDLEQLISPSVSLFDIHTDILVDIDALWEKKRIRPDQVLECLALIGDTADNYPGVEGVGEKTAAKLIAKYGSIAGIFEHLEELTPRLKQNMVAARDRLALNRNLARLKDDLELPFTLEQATIEGIDAAGIDAFFDLMGFRKDRTDLGKVLERYASAILPGREVVPGDLGSEPATAQLPEPDEEAAEPCSRGQYRAVVTLEELEQTIKEAGGAEWLAVDTETSGLGADAELCGISLAWVEGEAVYLPLKVLPGEPCLPHEAALERLRPLLESEKPKKTGHHLKFDWHVLRRSGIRMGGMAFDSMVAGHLLEEPMIGLDAMVLRRVGHRMIPIEELIGPKPRSKKQKQKTIDQVPLEQVTEYAAEDADFSLRLKNRTEPLLVDRGMSNLMGQLEMPLLGILARMEEVGIMVDPDELDRQKLPLKQRLEVIRDSIGQIADRLRGIERPPEDGMLFSGVSAKGSGTLNLDSTQQLSTFLFDDLGLPVVKKTKTLRSTDMEVLETLLDRDGLTDEQVQVLEMVAEYRQLAKLVGTYLENLKQGIDPKTGRVHCKFNQTETATGRLSSSDPNLQNIPIRTELGRNIRKAFVAAPGHKLIAADYSQIELRMLAHLSGDENLCRAFNEGLDIHRAVAAEVFKLDPEEVTSEQRGHAKTINFGIIYGVTPFGLARRIEGLDVPAARRLIDDYRSRFPGIDRFLADCVQEAERNGYVTTMMGRRRTIGEFAGSGRSNRGLGERLAINTRVQGSAAELIKLAMVRLDEQISAGSLPMRLLLQIHDELVVEVPEQDAEAMGAVLKEVMEGSMKLAVPLEVGLSIGRNWFEAK